MQTRKVLFLDIDGVVHRAFEPGESTIVSASLEELREERSDLFEWAGLLSDVLASHECDVIVHSSWRAYVPDDILRDCLGPLRRRFKGCTPRALSREASVLDVVRARRLSADSYMVLDDDAAEFEQLRHQIIVCTPERGVDDARVAAQLRGWLAARPAQQEGAA